MIVKPGTVVGVVGLGYVGLPIAVEFGKKFTTVGFDLSMEKIGAYRRHSFYDLRYSRYYVWGRPHD